MAISSKKLLGTKGGALAVRPKTNLVPLKKQSSSISKIGKKDEDPMLVIKTKVIKIEDILKGTLAAEKRAADEKRKAQEQEDRSKQEEEIEADPKSKEKGIKLPIPKKVKSWWQAIKDYFTTVLLGWLGIRLMKWIPKLKPILSFLVGFANFVIDWGGKILNGLVTFVDWGYKAVEATEKWIGDKFGEGAAEKFNSFTGLLTKTMNLVMALGIAAAAMGGKGPKGPKGKPKGKPKKTKLQKKFHQKWKKSAVGKRVRNLQASKKKLTRKISQALKPKNIAQSKWFKKGKIFLQGAGDTIVKVGKGVLNSLPNFNKLGQQLGGALTDAYNASSTWVKKRYDNVVDISKALKSKWDNALGAAGDAFNKLKKGAQQKIMEKVLKPVMEFLQPLITKLKGMGGSIMKTLQKIPGFDQIMKVLNKFGGAGSEGLLKKIGGKAIPIIGGVVNLGFAYDRLSKGDSIGGLIEGTSGILDLIGLIPGGQFGPPISMLMDGYMFARDFVPQIQEGEEAAVKKLGLSGFKSNIDNIFSKLPGIGEIAKMITGGKKDDPIKESVENNLTTRIKGDLTTITVDGKKYPRGLSGPMETFGGQGGSTYPSEKILPLDVNSVKVKNISQYNDDLEDVVVVNKGSIPQNESSNDEEKVTIINGGGGDTSDPYANSYRGN